MTNITLWQKDAVSDTLGGVPVARKILFNDPNKGIELYEWLDWQNNIVVTENSNKTGERRANMEDAGFAGVRITLKGTIKVIATQEVTNLFNFLKVLQTTDALPMGRFNIDNPNGPAMSIVATATKGLSITKGSSIKWNPTEKSYDFNFSMIYGGDLT